MTDPISDLLTRLRNANRALRPEVELAHSKLKESVAQILKREGYLADCQVEGKGLRKLLKLKLKFQGRKGVLVGLRRISKPGLRRYAGVAKAPRVISGMGIAIISTSRGLMTDREMRQGRVGGEVLCYVW